ncbi:hypothetical protein [Methanoculleus sp.]|jgi:hypothetical protein|uniref:hypothetical protein n=1 Tax=Methanoculleus sp. TaxID=90427 RepID=UPI0025E1A269|nr:hypothetical protein [Methanoculleus sp.]MCK9319385.1 hypothetical protein [Methanoculleus sp.]
MDESDNALSPGEFESVRFKSFPTKAKITFFYENRNGVPFAAEEQEAANGKYNKKFRFLGWSDGTKYVEVFKTAGLKKGQVISKEEAGKLLKLAFDSELKVAENNLAEARKNGTNVPRPQRVEYYFDGSVPERERLSMAGNKYGIAGSNQ